MTPSIYSRVASKRMRGFVHSTFSLSSESAGANSSDRVLSARALSLTGLVFPLVGDTERLLWLLLPLFGGDAA